jgi:RNA polymerase primary sigma factor
MVIEENTLKYIKSNKHSLLTSEREREIGEVLRNHKEGKEREKVIKELISHNLYLVVKVAYKYSKKTGKPLDEFIGAGNLGLVRASKLFDPDKFNTKFSTYATYWIIMEILKLIKLNSSPVTIPLYIIDLHNRYKKLTNESDISDEKLMNELQINSDNLQKVKMANISYISIDESIDNGNNSEKKGAIKDILEDPSAISPAEKAEKDGEFSMLYSAINELDETSRNIILARYLSEDDNQLKKIGEKFNLSSERVRQISEKALTKLRKKISEKRFHDKR